MNPSPRTPSAAELSLLAQIAREVARSRRLAAADAQDFIQSVHVRFLEPGNDVFQRFQGRSSLRTYLTVVVMRMMLDWLNTNYSRWRPSLFARRLGEPAMALERLIERDGYSSGEAVALLTGGRHQWPASMLEGLAAQLPRRTRRRRVSEDVLEWGPGAPFEDPIDLEDARRAKAGIGRALRTAVRELPADERKLVIRRYARRHSVQALAKELSIDPKVLYRRFEQTLRSLRRALVAAGVDGPESMATAGGRENNYSVSL